MHPTDSTSTFTNQIQDVVEHARRPYWWRQQYLQRLGGPLEQAIRGNDGIHFMDEDWDNLIILDACRSDLFEELLNDRGINLQGEYEVIRSRGSGSREFIRRNFKGRRFHDTVYISANPFLKLELPNDAFHWINHVWRDGWNEKHATVLPETMVREVLEASQRFPNKRLIAHFMQPHYPFLGDKQVDSGGFAHLRTKALDGNGESDRDVWERLYAGEVSKSEVWAAYQSNLDLVLSQVEELLPDLRGRTIITSDHGNALGERHSLLRVKVFGHPVRLRMDCLVEVPWYVVDDGERRDISSDAPVTDTDVQDSAVVERLKKLGYVE